MILQGNSFRLALRDESVHVVASSFPYWGLRDYGLQPLVFGRRDDCGHEWGEADIFTPRLASETNSEKQKSNRGTAMEDGRQSIGQFCQLCGAWRGSFGLEPTIDLHVKHAVMVCREIKRVLRSDGVFWLNYGDSYATGKNGRSAADGKATGNDDRTFRDKPFGTAGEVRAKNLCMIPQRVALALQADGWIIRSAPPWVKRNPMPESVKDRPGTGHEYVFMLVKSDRYFWDMDGIRREPVCRPKGDRDTYSGAGQMNHENDLIMGRRPKNESPRLTHPSGRALRTSDFFFDSLDSYIAHLQDIRDNGGLMLEADGSPAAFVVNPKGYAGAHYATWPVALVAPMIRSSTSDRGVCPKCGAPWVRVVEPSAEYAKHLDKDWADYGQDKIEGRGHSVSGQRPTKRNGTAITADYKTTGWQPSCSCNAGEPIPAIVLDPFCGSGSTGQAANELGRRFVGVDLNPSYLALNALPRSENGTSQAAIEQLPMFAGKAGSQ